MDTTLTIKLPKKLRDEAKKVAEELGIPMTTAVQAGLKRLVRERQLVLEAECPYPSHTPNAETRRAIREGRDPKNRHKLRSYKTPDEMFRAILGPDWRSR